MTGFWLDDEAPKQWTLADIYDDIILRGDISRILNVNRHRVDNWIKRREKIRCPMPIKELSQSTVIYSAQEWKDWYAAWIGKRKPGTKWTDNARTYWDRPPPALPTDDN